MKRRKPARLKRSDNLALQIFVVICVTLGTFFSLFPLAITILNSFKSNTEVITNIYALPDLGTIWEDFRNNYGMAWESVIVPLLRSVLTSGLGAGINTVIGLVLAYIFVHKDFHFKRQLFLFFIMVMLIPYVMGMPVLVPFITNTLSLKDTYLGYFLPVIAGGQVGSLFLFRVFFGQQPKSLFESMKLDGAKDIDLIRFLVVPLAKPIMLFYFVGNFASLYNDYFWPSLIFNNKMTLMPMMLSITEKFSNLKENGGIYAAYIVAGIPLIVVTAINIKKFKGGDFASGMKM